ncbi:MAG: histidine decarboxylase [Gammaproteobacteria bacterium]|jgi:histidine decarboxylase
MRSKQGLKALAVEGLLIHDEHNAALAKSDILERHATRLIDRKHRFLGYQTNQEVTFHQDLIRFLSFNLLNLGDGFEEGNYHLNAKNFERAIIHYYAKLWNLIGANSDDELAYWGYVTPMGASEGNLCALWYARD